MFDFELIEDTSKEFHIKQLAIQTSGLASHAEGFATNAIGAQSHAEEQYNSSRS